MADTKISALSAASALAGTEEIPIVQSAATVKATPAQIATYVLGGSITVSAAGRALLDDADATAQRATLGLTIGTNVQAYDAELAAIAGLTSAADKGIQFTGSGTAATYDLTTAGKALLDDADATAQRATLGLTIGTNVQAYDATLAAWAAYNTNGILTQTAADTFTGRTITGTSNRLTVTDGDGVSGNPTLDISSSYVGQATITTLGTIGTGTWQGSVISSTYGGTGVNNAGRTLTVNTNNGTLDFTSAATLTIPATGTANLLGTAQTITAIKTTTITDAATNTTTNPIVLGHNSSGTPAASFGVGLKMTLHSTTTTDQDAAQVEAIWTTATHASRTSALIFSTVNSAAALAEALRITPLQVLIPSGTSYAVATPMIAKSGQTGTGISWSGNGVYFHNSGASALAITSNGVTANANRMIGWSAAGPDAGSADTAFERASAGVINAINGTAGQWAALKAGTRDAGTNTIVDGLTLGHQSSGTPAAGLGTGLMFNINSTTTADQNAVRETAEWVVATHASRTARYKLQVYDTAAREVLRGEASGSAPMIGVLGAAAIARQTVAADATDLASAITLVNDIKAKLGASAGFGFFA